MIYSYCNNEPLLFVLEFYVDIDIDMDMDMVMDMDMDIVNEEIWFVVFYANPQYTMVKSQHTKTKEPNKKRRREDSNANGYSRRIYGNDDNTKDSKRFPKNALVD